MFQKTHGSATKPPLNKLLSDGILFEVVLNEMIVTDITDFTWPSR